MRKDVIQQRYRRKAKDELSQANSPMDNQTFNFNPNALMSQFNAISDGIKDDMDEKQKLSQTNSPMDTQNFNFNAANALMSQFSAMSDGIKDELDEKTMEMLQNPEKWFASQPSPDTEKV